MCITSHTYVTLHPYLATNVAFKPNVIELFSSYMQCGLHAASLRKLTRPYVRAGAFDLSEARELLVRADSARALVCTSIVCPFEVHRHQCTSVYGTRRRGGGLKCNLYLEPNHKHSNHLT